MSIIRVFLITLFMMGGPFLWQAISQQTTPRSWHLKVEEKDVASTVLKGALYASATFLLGLFAFDMYRRRSKKLKRLLRKRHTPHHR